MKQENDIQHGGALAGPHRSGLHKRVKRWDQPHPWSDLHSASVTIIFHEMKGDVRTPRRVEHHARYMNRFPPAIMRTNVSRAATLNRAQRLGTPARIPDTEESFLALTYVRLKRPPCSVYDSKMNCLERSSAVTSPNRAVCCRRLRVLRNPAMPAGQPEANIFYPLLNHHLLPIGSPEAVVVGCCKLGIFAHIYSEATKNQ